MASEDSGDGLREETMSANRRHTWEGCSVLLDINDGDRLVFAMLTHGATLKIGKKKFPLAPLIGCPFGSLFKVETSSNGSHLARFFPSSAPEAATEQVKDHCHASVEFKDNRSLVDNNTAQGLSSEDIDAMRREGATGEEIVEALITNSSTFDKKTTFSQEKYKVKKQKKYAPKVLLRRPFSRSICEAYFKKSPTRIGSLRVDALSLLLSMANVGAYSDVLVLDTVGGLLTGAVAERLGGTGYVCCTYFGSSNLPIDIVRMFNFSSDVNSRIVQASFTDLIGEDNDEPSSQPDNPKPHAANTNTLLSAESIIPKSLVPVLHDESLEEVNVSNAKFGYSKEIFSELNSVQTSPHVHSRSFNEDGRNAQPCSISEKLIPPGRKASTELIKTWKRRGFTSLIVAAPEMEVDSLVQKLLPLISYSGPFAVYHHCLQPLAICMHNLQTSKMAVSLQISEPWLREYQVLPSRTHPHMQTSGFGGYILSGIKVCGGSGS
ncbi:hypothetical protein HPP92_022102 [Vanilla planifolia]|uniref:tRNA (adenine(58)-N(1))-methyltransferase non-catalytic subunit TRM6 n=1 Tax=Vanilla planifolia TaxID=51239 RepID=A0A835PSQ8_VANPL|nr:hypothetical protein HPP92_022102 [Vanilla planifolia]